VPNKQYVPKRH